MQKILAKSRRHPISHSIIIILRACIIIIQKKIHCCSARDESIEFHSPPPHQCSAPEKVLSARSRIEISEQYHDNNDCRLAQALYSFFFRTDDEREREKKVLV